ncbi:glycosyltransferase family 2 protein [Candidatus Daviesbacteria bacterium]|nr:glycosyltransferase family 2 protein [Candidatus Daviesbacteria bacterium]
MKIAIITLNYNGKINTLELLESLGKLDSHDFELKTIVLDNASSDSSVSTIKKAFPKVDILQTGINLGFGGGYNKGFEYASIWGADYFFVINNDSKIDGPHILQKLIDVAAESPQIGIVAPKILFEKGFEFHKERYSKDELGKVIWFGGGSFDWDNIKSVHRGIDQVDHGEYDVVEETEFVSGACFLIKKEVLEKAGGFDGDYFLYFEDADLCQRVSRIGFKLYFCGKTQIYHKVSQSTGIGSIITDYYHTRNRLIFGMKYAKNRTKFALLREALGLFLFGRPAQRQGVLDYYLGIKGGKAELMDVKAQPSYPLRLSIGIVNYNTPNLTKKLLQSIFIKSSGYDPKIMEVIVLDNGSTENLREVIRQFLPKIKYIQNTQNEGFSKGYNKTIRYSLGQYYLMLNSDIEVIDDSLPKLIKAADEFNGEAVLGGKLIFPDSSKQDSAFHLPTIWGALKEYFLAQKGSYFMYEPKSDQPSQVEGLVMACFLIPKKILQKVGLLDEETFIFFEDIEYCKRLKQMGVPIYFVPSAKFTHHHGASTKKIGQEKAYGLLQKGAEHYHGKIYYKLLTFVLQLGQKLGRVKTPVSRWTKD